MKPTILNACSLLAPYFRSGIQAPDCGWPRSTLVPRSPQLDLLLAGKPPYHEIDPSDRGLLCGEVLELCNRARQAESAVHEIDADLFVAQGELLERDQREFYSAPENRKVGSVVAAFVDTQLNRLREMLAVSKQQNENLEGDLIEALGRVDELETQVLGLMNDLEGMQAERDEALSENDELRKQLGHFTQTSSANPWDDVTDSAWQGETMKLVRRADPKIKLRAIKWEDTNSQGLSYSLVGKVLGIMEDDFSDANLHEMTDGLRKAMPEGRGTRRFSIVQHGAQLANIVKYYCWLTKTSQT